METYVVLRRNGWMNAKLRAAVEQSFVKSERTLDDIGWIRSYVLHERDGSVGAVCVVSARSPEAIRRHAAAAGLRVDEIVKVAGNVVVHPNLLSMATGEAAVVLRPVVEDRNRETARAREANR